MQLIAPQVEIVRWTEGGYDAIEEVGRLCTGTKMAATIEDQEAFLKKLIKMNHQTPFEQMTITVKFTADIGVGREALRHRMTSPMQESTRYCRYGDGIKVVQPFFFDPSDDAEKFDLEHAPPGMEFDDNRNWTRLAIWQYAMNATEWAYLQLLNTGASPQQARSVLPLSTSAPWTMKATVREWWLIMSQRALGETGKPHPQMLEVMAPLLNAFKAKWPTLFTHVWPCDHECPAPGNGTVIERVEVKSEGFHQYQPEKGLPLKQHMEFDVTDLIKDNPAPTGDSKLNALWALKQLAPEIDTKYLQSFSTEQTVTSTKTVLHCQFSNWRGREDSIDKGA